MSAILESINTGAPPATYGEGERPPRGDYARARADYTCEQRHDAYTAVDHALYRRLHERQSRQLEGLACRDASPSMRGNRIKLFMTLLPSRKVHHGEHGGHTGFCAAKP